MLQSRGTAPRPLLVGMFPLILAVLNREYSTPPPPAPLQSLVGTVKNLWMHRFHRVHMKDTHAFNFLCLRACACIHAGIHASEQQASIYHMFVYIYVYMWRNVCLVCGNMYVDVRLHVHKDVWSAFVRRHVYVSMHVCTHLRRCFPPSYLG